MSRIIVFRYRVFAGLLAGLFAVPTALAERETVLRQIQVPHNYYFREMYLPQLTSGPSSAAWLPAADPSAGDSLVYSMQGSLWLQTVGSDTAKQLTAGPGYDYQPDGSPDGKSVVFARYLDDSVELYLLVLADGSVRRLTSTGAVNLEPRWSPDGSRLAWVSTEGTGRFHIRIGAVNPDTLRKDGMSGERFLPERRSRATRYYYSEFDHEISPAWSPDGSELLYVSNPENAYGTGGLWRRGLAGGAIPVLLRDEETTWKARPDWSPDGGRIIWSSYQGRQWQQLWLTTSAEGGDPLPLTFGEFDITSPRWSPDGKRIAYISNEPGNTSLWVLDIPGGAKRPVVARERQYLHPMGQLDLRITDGTGAAVAARVAVTGSDGRSYAPDQAWVHGDDGFDRENRDVEAHYFHVSGEALLNLPPGTAEITVWRGLENAIARRTIHIKPGKSASLSVQSEPLAIPETWKQQWISGDVHVHMNYGGAYRNTPPHLVQQAEAEDLDLVFNLIVNKEQRFPDMAWFSTAPDSASTDQVLLLHSEEFHTSYWGHLGLLGLDDHLLLPGFSAYPNTAFASPFPDNATVADLAHEQHALVGYVHPYDEAPNPGKDATLTSGLPIDVALGKVDYYEVSGFSDFRPTQEIWHRLLNCGFRISAAGGTDAMANYASLRGPVGLNRVYVQTAAGDANPTSRRDRWLKGLKAGRTLATNGPILGFELDGQGPGGELSLAAGGQELRFQGFMQSIVPVDHLEIVLNGTVVETLPLDESRRSARIEGRIHVSGSGWVVLRAWNDHAHPDVFDRFPFATTNPVFITVPGAPLRSPADVDYFLAWIARVREQTLANPNYTTVEEKEAVLASIDAAAAEFARRME